MLACFEIHFTLCSNVPDCFSDLSMVCLCLKFSRLTELREETFHSCQRVGGRCYFITSLFWRTYVKNKLPHTPPVTTNLISFPMFVF